MVLPPEKVAEISGIDFHLHPFGDARSIVRICLFMGFSFRLGFDFGLRLGFSFRIWLRSRLRFGNLGLVGIGFHNGYSPVFAMPPVP
jgi:hypothetical protein